MYPVESLLSARSFVSPQRHGDVVRFISDMSGRLSLYAMDVRGSVPVPLLPPNVALHNPKLLGGHSFCVFPDIDRIVVMIDEDGDERYHPCWIPIEGGFPSRCFPEERGAYRYHLRCCSRASHTLYFMRENEEAATQEAVRLDLTSGDVAVLATSRWGCSPEAVSRGGRKVLLVQEYKIGDDVLYLWVSGVHGLRLLAGTPRERRSPGSEHRPTSISSPHFTRDEAGILCVTAEFDDAFGVGYIDIRADRNMQPVPIHGLMHQGRGELTQIHALSGDDFALEYNIDGCSWVYRARFDAASRRLMVGDVLCGERPLDAGTLQAFHHDPETGRFVLSFSSATSPSQLVMLDRTPGKSATWLTRERVLGVPTTLLSPGEDASYRSFDGERISARLYLPPSSETPSPLVYYIHGGPQSQERPDFTWFSMPLIQFLILNGFAVFVPNVRGSTGYGLRYARLVENDWGGADRLDHVAAMAHLASDPRIDVSRAAVMGRSYGGYMTLTLAFRHPELWSAAVDMFGVYDLLGFVDRIPVTWRPYFRETVGDPDTEEGRRLLLERSPKQYMHRLACPLFVIQGANDPRVVPQESGDLVDALRAAGKQVEYLLFPDEGHDVLKFSNRVRCYNAIIDFFQRHLRGAGGVRS